MSFHNYFDKVKRHFGWTTEDWWKLLVVALCFGFIITFNGWGTASFDAPIGLRNLLVGSALCGLALFIHHAAQRLVALKQDSSATQEVWWNGLLLGIIIAFITRGTVPFLAGTGTYNKDLRLHRLGHFSYKGGTNIMMMTAVAGPIANTLTAIIALALLSYNPHWEMLKDFATISLLMAAMNMLPIPPLDGTRVFFVSRMAFAIIGGGIIATFAGYLWIGQLSWSLIWLLPLGALISGVCWWYFAEKED
jgi:Zn-dependent protease